MGVQEEILELKVALEEASKDGSMEQMVTVLKALEKLKGITVTMVSVTKIGNVLKKLSKTHAMTPAAELGSAILKEWRIVADKAKTKVSSTPLSSAPTPTPPPPPPPPPVPVTEPIPAVTVPAPATAFEVVSHESQLPEGRRKMFQLFFDMLQKDRGVLDGKQQRRLQEQALAIEFCVEAAFPYTGRDYTERIRTLVINMKKNSALRDAVVSGTLPPAELATMPTAQLATEEVFRLRQAAAAELSEARMLDWEKAHAADLARDCGVDPDNVWEYDADDASDAGAD